MTKIRSAVLLCVVGSLVLSVPSNSTGADKKAKSDAEIVQTDVTNFLKAFHSGDVDTVVGYTHPLIIEKLGGMEMTKSAMKRVHATLKSIEMKVDSMKFPAEPTFLKTEKHTFAIVPTITIFSTKGRRVESLNYQFGIRSVGEKKWTYMEGSRISQKNVRSFFPDFPSDYEFPKFYRKLL